jgi:hypothetical protein
VSLTCTANLFSGLFLDRFNSSKYDKDLTSYSFFYPFLLRGPKLLIMIVQGKVSGFTLLADLPPIFALFRLLHLFVRSVQTSRNSSCPIPPRVESGTQSHPSFAWFFVSFIATPSTFTAIGFAASLKTSYAAISYV